jgi:aminoglycoside phosphotransferase (APT) family kinase protein
MMSAEPLLYELLQEQKVPTSKVIHYDSTFSIVDREYIILEYIPSIPMNDPSVPVGAKSALNQLIGEIFSSIHNIQNDHFGWVRPDHTQELFGDWDKFLNRFSREIADRCSDHSAFKDDKLCRFLRIFDEPIPFNQVRQARMVHTDFWEGNVLVAEKDGKWEVAAIIDFDKAIFGDIDMEFTSPWTTNEHFLRGYGRKLDDSPASIYRRKAYRLLGSFMYAYIWLVQYEDLGRFEVAKQRGLAELRHIYWERDEQ